LQLDVAFGVEARAGRRLPCVLDRAAAFEAARSRPASLAGIDGPREAGAAGGVASGQRSGKRRIPDASTDQAGMQLEGVTPGVARTGAMRRTAGRPSLPAAAERAAAADAIEAAGRFGADERRASSAAQAPPATTSGPSKARQRTPR
jgi:hypothetical protein